MLSFNPLSYPYSSRRNLVYAARGMAASSHPLATEAGLHILRSGGNAVDAALAVAAALTVLDPANCGPGGDCFAIVQQRGKPLVGLNSSGFSPALLDKATVTARGYDTIPFDGWLPVTVPGAPAAWCALSRRFGVLPLPEVFAPAVELAEGYALSPDNADVLNLNTAEIARLVPRHPELDAWFALFNPERKTFRAGEWYALPALGRTLQAVAQTNGAAFYRGTLSDEIGKYSAATGGLLRADDLAAYQPRWVTPVHTRYRGYDVWELPPNGQGLTALMALNILENFQFAGRDDPQTLHVQMEAIKLAFSDALHEIADPAYMRRTVDELLSKDYAKTRSGLITPSAQSYAPGQPLGSDTVYFCTADAEGNMVSMIQSLYRNFGSRVVVPGTGICLQDRGACFSMQDGHVNQVAPRKYPYHTIIPGFLTRDGAPVGPFGIMGGYMQPQAHVQFLMNLLDFGLNPQAALDAPRFCWQEELAFFMESAFSPETVAALRARGHDIRIVDDRTYGRGQAIFRTADGTLCGATEPRADGCVLGY